MPVISAAAPATLRGTLRIGSDAAMAQELCKGVRPRQP
jgi:hypothetical protein